MNDPIHSVAELLNTEQAKNLLSPITKELGQTLGDFGSIVRFYTRNNWEKIFTKWGESGRTISPKDFEKVTPLLLLAATVSDDELQTRWAALLESAVSDSEGFLPSFGRTLSELTAEEARYLDRIWKVVSQPPQYLPEYRLGRTPLSFQNLVQLFDASINTGVNAAEMELAKGQFEMVANYERLGHAELVIQDLERLGILAREPVAESRADMYQIVGEQTIPIGQGRTELRFQYSLSQYGVSFIKAVTIKDKPAR